MAGDQPPSSQPPIEGIDYYIEAGHWVFTAAYHLRRGTCCDNRCRHCPYRSNEPPATKFPASDSHETPS